MPWGQESDRVMTRLLSWSNQGWSPQRSDIRAGTWLTKQSQTHVNIRTKNATKNIQVEKKINKHKHIAYEKQNEGQGLEFRSGGKR